MGALRRQGSSGGETLPTELANYASPVDNERLTLEAFLDPKRNPELQRNAMRQPVRSQLHPSAPQPQVNNYRQAWEQPGMGINGCNLPNLPQEAYQIPGDLNLDTAPVEDFASRNRHPQKVGLGPYAKQLMDFHEKQKQPTAGCTLENFWRPLFEEYFASNATMYIEIKAEDSPNMRLIKLPVEALPRIWLSKFDAGVQEERLLMENPCEYMYVNGYVVVDCRKTVIITKYEQSTVIADGHLRVHLQNDKKIMLWHFSPSRHQELVPMSLARHGVPPPSAICKHGMPLSVLRLMSIAEDIGKMGTKIDAEISRLLRKTTKQRDLQAQQREQELKTTTGFVGISKGEPKRTAYHAILSQFGVQGMPLDQARNDAAVRNAVNAGGIPAAPTVQGLAGTVQGLQNNIAMDLKRSVANDNRNSSNVRDSMPSWRPDQPDDVFPNIFEPSSMRPPFAQRENPLANRGVIQKRGEMEAKKHMAPSLAVAQDPQAGQSVVDVVTATATGHAGWAVGSTPERNFPNTEQQGDELDPSLQLLNTVPPDCDMSLQSGREAPGNGQSAPPGLSIFTPQVEELEKNGKTPSGRAKVETATIRDVRPSTNHATVNGNHKNYGNVRSFQRMSSNRMKRSNQTTSPTNTRPSSAAPSIVGVSQGVAAQNGGAPTKRNSPGRTTKNGSDHATAATGSRRNSQRNSGSDGREKRQKTSQTVNQT